MIDLRPIQVQTKFTQERNLDQTKTSVSLKGKT